MDLYIL